MQWQGLFNHGSKAHILCMDITPHIRESRVIIDGYGDGGFRVNGERRDGALIVLEDHAVSIPATDLQSLTPAMLQPLFDAAEELDVVIFGMGILVVYLVLSAQYESYTDPLIILMTVPTAMLGALVFLSGAGQVLNIYAQVGLVMLIGLAGGNAILIVDLANQKMGEGESALEAAKFSAKSRLRPILMTAISSLTGFLPLMLASGAGAQSQSSLGLVVFGGLLVATFLSTLVVPVFYVVMKSLLGQADAKPPEGGDGDVGQNAQSVQATPQLS